MDYRNTKYCEELIDVEKKKKMLEKKIGQEHPRTKIFYEQINKRECDYWKEFGKIYNSKCAYCGVPVWLLSPDCFEIDHFICKTSFPDTEEGKIKAGKIENLVFACTSCNRSKSNLRIKSEYCQKLNTDNGNIAKVFERGEDYSIRIRPEYMEDEFVNRFYNKLRLGYQRRRLDYLLLAMDKMEEKEEDEKKKMALGYAVKKLLKIRNSF